MSKLDGELCSDELVFYYSQGGVMLDIARDFNGHVATLLNAVEAGRSAHGTANISESGKPFEEACRALFARALPETFNVVPGYFFNSAMALSPQVDALICDRSGMLQLSPAASLEQRYVAYGSVRAVIQIKNGVSGLGAALAQSAKVLRAWRDMRQAESGYGYGSNDVCEPMSIVFIGKDGDQAKVQNILESAPGPLPAYVLQLDSGVMYGPAAPLRSLLDYGPGVSRTVTDRATRSGENGKPLALLEAGDAVSDSRGVLLMWLFFTVLHHLGLDEKNSTLKVLVERISNDYPVVYARNAKMIQPSAIS